MRRVKKETTKNLTNIALPPLLEKFFCEYLINQRSVSPETVFSYRDTFRLLVQFTERDIKKAPAALMLEDWNATRILGFLDNLERERQNSVRSRNCRLTAIRSFMRYVGLQEPTALSEVRRVLAIPLKKTDRPAVDFLLREEVESLLAAPDSNTWSGHRDQVMFATLYNTGVRVSEIVSLNVEDFTNATTATLRILGKGRKERVVPLWKTTKRQIRDWLCCIHDDARSPLFPNRHGQRLTRSGVRRRIQTALKTAAKRCPTLRGRRVSPHLFRHTMAMHMLQSGIEITVIALWLGHESTATTHMYVEADMEMKKRAIEKITKPHVESFQFKTTDRLLAFLESL